MAPARLISCAVCFVCFLTTRVMSLQEFHMLREVLEADENNKVDLTAVDVDLTVEIQRWVQACDTNGDDEITLQELLAACPDMNATTQASLTSLFQSYDKNGDGELGGNDLRKIASEQPQWIDTVKRAQRKATLAQLGQQPGNLTAQGEAWLQACDTNNDSQVSLQELMAAYPNTNATTRAGLTSLFQSYDANGDGELGGNELRKIASEQPQWIDVALQAAQQKPTFAQLRQQPNTSNVARAGLWMQSCDKNKDGQVSLQELLAAYPAMNATTRAGLTSLFQSYDANGDGELGPDECNMIVIEQPQWVDVVLDAAQQSSNLAQLGQHRDHNLTARAKVWLQVCDTNADGQISLKELLAAYPGINATTTGALTLLFSSYDMNGDGELGGEELRKVVDDQPQWIDAALQARQQSLLFAKQLTDDDDASAVAVVEALDTNGDGEVSVQEFIASPVDINAATLALYDKDESGQLTAGELTKLITEHPEWVAKLLKAF